MLGTLLNPYGWRIYSVVYDVATQPGGMDKISELQSLPFRNLSDYLVLFFALGAAAVLARGKRLPLFEAGLLVFGRLRLVPLAARSVGDGGRRRGDSGTCRSRSREKNRSRVPAFATPFAGCRSRRWPWPSASRAMHDQQLSAQRKARRDDARGGRSRRSRRTHYPGPLYNDFNWGGYLIWALRMPVSIDGRGAMYGDEAIDRSVATWNAEPDWGSDPQLASAGVVIGPVKAPLTQVLRLDPQLKLAYEDKLAAVFVAPQIAPMS